jgi:hypothetical protein
LNEIKTSLPPAVQILPSPDSAPANKIPPLNRGEILEGTLLEQKEPGLFFMRIKGQDLWVKSQVPLLAGGKILLEVEAVSPQVLLKLLPVEAEGGSTTLDPFKKILGDGVPLKVLAEKLTGLGNMNLDLFPAEIKRALQEIKEALGQYAPPFLADPRTLREKISQSGLFWENRLGELIRQGREEEFLQVNRQDLKGLLLKLKSLLGEAFSLAEGNVTGLPKGGEVLSLLEPYLQKIEAYQLLNQRYGDSSEKWLLLLPLWFGGETRFLEMSMGFSGEKSPPSKEETSLLFFLDLPEAGKIKIEVVIRAEELFCRFHLAALSFQEEIQRNLPELEGRLRTLGFHPSFSIAEEPWEQPQEAIVSRLDESGENFVSLIV